MIKNFIARLSADKRLRIYALAVPVGVVIALLAVIDPVLAEEFNGEVERVVETATTTITTLGGLLAVIAAMAAKANVVPDAETIQPEDEAETVGEDVGPGL